MGYEGRDHDYINPAETWNLEDGSEVEGVMDVAEKEESRCHLLINL